MTLNKSRLKIIKFMSFIPLINAMTFIIPSRAFIELHLRLLFISVEILMLKVVTIDNKIHEFY